MNEPLAPPSADRLDAAVAEYLEADQQGRSLSRDELLSRYADVSLELGQFFADHDRMFRLAEPIRAVVSETSRARAAADATLGPNTLAELPAVASAESSRSIAGYRMGDYEIQSELGRGGMGVVYKARHVRLNRVVALKMVLAGQFAAPEDLQRFQAEAQAAAALEHPGIVPIFEAGHCQASLFLDGIRRRPQPGALEEGPLPLVVSRAPGRLPLSMRMLACPRDLKPANILLANADAAADLEATQPKITDFGLAKREGGDSHLTASGQVLGTPAFMPPEQAAGRVHEIGPAADVYALGAILYAMLTGQPPFAAESQLEILLQVLERSPRSRAAATCRAASWSGFASSAWRRNRPTAMPRPLLWRRTWTAFSAANRPRPARPRSASSSAAGSAASRR
jgi:serine/threonine protein kinase